jgi:hypothetical protein
VAKGLEEEDGVGQCQGWIAGQHRAERGECPCDLIQRRLEFGGVAGECGIRAGFGNRLASFAHEQVHCRTTLHHRLAPEQVDGLDAVRAFVDGIEAVVAVELFHRVFACVAVAAMNLDRQAVGFETPLRRPGFGDRSQQVEEQPGFVNRRVVSASALRPCGNS